MDKHRDAIEEEPGYEDESMTRIRTMTEYDGTEEATRNNGGDVGSIFMVLVHPTRLHRTATFITASYTGG